MAHLYKYSNDARHTLIDPYDFYGIQYEEATVEQNSRGSPPKVFYKYTANLQENTHAKVWLQFEITLRHRCSPVNFLYIFRTFFPKNTSGELLLE